MSAPGRFDPYADVVVAGEERMVRGAFVVHVALPRFHCRIFFLDTHERVWLSPGVGERRGSAPHLSFVRPRDIGTRARKEKEAEKSVAASNTASPLLSIICSLRQYFFIFYFFW